VCVCVYEVRLRVYCVYVVMQCVCLYDECSMFACVVCVCAYEMRLPAWCAYVRMVCVRLYGA